LRSLRPRYSASDANSGYADQVEAARLGSSVAAGMDATNVEIGKLTEDAVHLPYKESS
jgi:hypothetical protein